MNDAEGKPKDPLADAPGDPPAPSEVRSVILTEHKHIRALLKALEEAAHEVKRSAQASAFQNLRERGATLLGRMRNHIALENRILAPALRDTDAYGPYRARKLIEDHALQDGQLQANLMLLDDRAQPAQEIADAMLDLIAFIRQDMEEEERTLLDPNLLRDDIITTDMYTG